MFIRILDSCVSFRISFWSNQISQWLQLLCLIFEVFLDVLSQLGHWLRSSRNLVWFCYGMKCFLLSRPYRFRSIPFYIFCHVLGHALQPCQDMSTHSHTVFAYFCILFDLFFDLNLHLQWMRDDFRLGRFDGFVNTFNHRLELLRRRDLRILNDLEESGQDLTSLTWPRPRTSNIPKLGILWQTCWLLGQPLHLTFIFAFGNSNEGLRLSANCAVLESPGKFWWRRVSKYPKWVP